MPSQSVPVPAGRPVRPRHAASLVLTRKNAGDVEILLGKREPRHRFMPNVYVFPGGRLDRKDYHTAPMAPLPMETGHRLTRHCSPAMAQALAVAAVRETFEETGLIVGELADTGLRPDLSNLHFLARAITPPDSPIRFHARFFLTELPPGRSRLAGNGELLDLQWVTIEQALTMPVVDVTEFVLAETARYFEGQTDRRTPLFHYSRGKATVRRRE